MATPQVLVEQSLIGWKEFELEVMRDLKDNCMIVCSIENVDPMGVHTGDSITVAPAQTLTDKEYQRLRDAAIAIIREMGVECGGSNVQMAINPVDGELLLPLCMAGCTTVSPSSSSVACCPSTCRGTHEQSALWLLQADSLADLPFHSFSR